MTTAGAFVPAGTRSLKWLKVTPAKVLSVSVVDEAARACRAVVPDYQLSLAIGREGQNARLAARLTGWRIDIQPDVNA